MIEKLPRGWVRTTLGEVCTLNPRTSLQDDPPEETEVSFVPMSAVEEESGRLDATQIRTIAILRKGYTPFIENDVIFAKITPCMENGKIAIASGLKNGLGYGSTEFIVLRPSAGLLPRFILHFLLQPSFRREAERRMTGAVGQKRIPLKYLSTHPLPLPPTSEQERIVARLDALLSHINAGEAAARRALRRLQRYRAAVLHAGVTGELTQHWRNKHQPKEVGAHLRNRLLEQRRIRWEEAELKRRCDAGKRADNDIWKKRYRPPIDPDASHVTRLPAGWSWMSLDQLTVRITSGSRDWSKYYDKGQGTFLLAQNIRRTGLDLTFRQLVGPPAKNRDRERSQVTKGDILVTIVGANTGDVCMVTTNLRNHFVSQSVALVRLAEPSFSKFVWLYLSSDDDGQRQWHKLIYGAGRPHLGLDHLRITALPVPPAAEQTEIAREVEQRLSAADRLSATLNQQLKRAEVTRESLLKEAFAGKLTKQEPNDEPAAILLDRILAARKAAANKPRSKHMRKSKATPRRRPLFDVLREQKRPITPEHLFREAGFQPADVDSFYRELATLRRKIRETKPSSKNARLWPQRARVLLELKED
jgi:type I restriction enzyme S subunit